MKKLIFLFSFGCVILFLISRTHPSRAQSACIQGDANGDGIVTLADYAVWRSVFLSKVTPQPTTAATPTLPAISPTTSPSSGTICGTVGFNGETASLPTFQTKYPAQWRSDYSFAEIYNTPGATYENFKVSTNLFVKSNNLIIRNFYLNPGSDYYPLRTDDREGGSGTVISNGTIAVTGATDDSKYKGIVAAVDNLTISDMDISGTHDGIGISANNITVSDVCIHNLGTAPTAHNDGIEIYSGSHIKISNAEIINDKGQTSAINITNDYGLINDVLIENVTLSGGGYTIYVRGDGASGGAPVTNIRFRNVKIAKPGFYGVISYKDAAGAIVEWDVKDATGKAIPHP
jgi:hypothetical protein